MTKPHFAIGVKMGQLVRQLREARSEEERYRDVLMRIASRPVHDEVETCELRGVKHNDWCAVCLANEALRGEREEGKK
mgnify:CR=1 FL=1